MNEPEHAELERLKKQQAALLEQLGDLGRKLVVLETGPSQPGATPAPSVPPIIGKISPAPAVPPPVPPVIHPPPAPAFVQKKAEIPPPKRVPPFPVESLDFRNQSAGVDTAQPPPVMPRSGRNSGPNQPPASESAGDAAASPNPKEPSFEMRLGTYWLVRVGVVMLLTGLVFFCNFAYQNYFGSLGPAGKILLLYVVSGGLLSAGAWLQRKQESLKNYSQVLLAGGLAAVYFTTFAAYHIAGLQVIKSPLLDGALLLGWAGFIIWLANQKKSEVLALFAVLLAYYTSVMTHVGLFTLYSNLVLTLAAVFFLVRNRWATLSFASLVATYVSYGFWRFYQDGHWQWATPGEGLWAGNYFLLGYWTLFTAAIFLSRHEQFSGGRRTSFLSLNNGVFFAAFTLTMLQVHHGGFWIFTLSYGGVLLGLAFLARRFLAPDELSRNAYLTQGLLFVTLGLFTCRSGLSFSLVMGVESVILLMLAQVWKSHVTQGAALIAAALAVAGSMVSLQPYNHEGLALVFTVGSLMLFNAFLLRRETTFQQSDSHPRIVFYTALGLVLWLAATWNFVRPDWRGFALAGESVVFLFACRQLGNRVLRFGAVLFAGLAAGCEMLAAAGQFIGYEPDLQGSFMPGAIIGALLILNALWERRASPLPDDGHTFSPLVAFFSGLGLLSWVATTCLFAPREYLTASWSALALAFFFLGMVFRERVYRWLGLAVLACAVARVAVSDIWKLEPIYRVLSFMALGIVLLVLGFIYNKYQEKIKERL